MKKLLNFLFLLVFLTSATNVISQTVYVNKADSRYHLLTCKYLDASHDSLDITFAIKKGLGACPVCNPGAKGSSSSGSMGSMGTTKSMDAPKGMGRSEMGQQVNSPANADSKQCAVINKDGKRCIGKAEPGTIYCAMHKNYKK